MTTLRAMLRWEGGRLIRELLPSVAGAVLREATFGPEPLSERHAAAQPIVERVLTTLESETEMRAAPIRRRDDGRAYAIVYPGEQNTSDLHARGFALQLLESTGRVPSDLWLRNCVVDGITVELWPSSATALPPA